MAKILALLLLCAQAAIAQGTAITLVSTTTTQNSGLMDILLPAFEADTGIRVNLLSVGTGEAVTIARRGDADVILAHHRPSEDALLADGNAIDRRDVMHNDFVIIGPQNDPAQVRGSLSAAEALAKIAAARAPFAGRGDDSGTHKREQDLWRLAGIVPQGRWYRETGAGMGATLNIAAAMDAYLLSDRATWLAFGNKANLALLYQGGAGLLNSYGILLVNPQRHKHVKSAAARQFIDWIVSRRGQQLIAGYKLDGQQMFCPDALPELVQGNRQAAAYCAAFR